MERWWEVFATRPGELITGFVAGNLLWFSRQYLWQQWVKRSHKNIADANRREEERTRTEIRELRQQVSHISIALGLPDNQPVLEQERTTMQLEKYNSPNWSFRLGYKPQYMVYHWFGKGNLTSVTNRFLSWLNPLNRVSAHYAVSGTTVRQFVSEDKAAWHCAGAIIVRGISKANLESVGVENDAEVGRDAIEDTYHTSGQLAAEVHVRHGLGRPRIEVNAKGEHVGTIRPHNSFKATQCPGTFDLNRLVEIAQQRYDELTKPAPVVDSVQPSTPQPPQAQTVAPGEFPKKVRVAVPEGLMVREKATSKSKFINPLNHKAPLFQNAKNKQICKLEKGTAFTVVERVKGESVAGNDNWLKTKFGNYVWEGGV